MLFILMGVALLAGFMLANQNPINADLKTVVGSPFGAATISFAVGTLFLGVLALTTEHALLPSGAFISSHPAWIWLGGLLGGVYLTSNVLLFPRLGAIQTVILPIMGQIIMGTLIDTFGWFEAASIPLSLARVLGLVILIAGVVIAIVLPTLFNHEARSLEKTLTQVYAPTGLLGWRIWAIIAGMLSAMQQAINGHMGTLLHAPVQGSFLSFFIGFILILILTLVIDKRFPSLEQLKVTKVWNWFGGILGGLFVLASIIVIPHIGAGLTITMGLLGQIVGSMLVQQFGWWRSMKAGVNRLQMLGVIVMILGVVFIKFM
ncbi:MAG: DMT family transporter [Lactobacillaceae bacterium]|nr:DMT family transporter [Lactobacillaceae bacterium]